MELKDRKIIGNSGRLPCFDNGTPLQNDQSPTNNPSWFSLNQDKLLGLGGGVMNLASNLYQSSIPSTSEGEIYNTGRQSTRTINGVDYTHTTIDGSQQLDAAKKGTVTSALGGMASGAAAGSVLGPWGALGGAVIGGIGGLLAGSSAKNKVERQINLAKRKAEYTNNINRYIAENQGIQKDFSDKYGNLESQSLWHAALGKPESLNLKNHTSKKYIVNTSEGKTKDYQNAWVSKGEVIEDGDTGRQYKVKSGKNDTARANLSPHDTVYSAKLKNIDTGHTIAKDAPLYSRLGISDRLKRNQEIARNMKYRKTNTGNFPRLAAGGEWYYNAIPAVTNLWLAAQKYNEASQDAYRPDTYRTNANANDALNRLSRINLDYYPIYSNAYNAERNAINALRNSGGLSSGQRLLGYTNIAANTQANNAATLANAQMQNNAYASQYADALMKAGEADRTARMNADRFDIQNWLAGENARKQGMDAARYDISNAIGKFFSNEFDRIRFNRIMNQYDNEQEEARNKNKVYPSRKNNTTPVFDNTLRADGQFKLKPSSLMPTTTLSLDPNKPAQVINYNPAGVNLTAPQMPYRLYGPKPRKRSSYSKRVPLYKRFMNTFAS